MRIRARQLTGVRRYEAPPNRRMRAYAGRQLLFDAKAWICCGEGSRRWRKVSFKRRVNCLNLDPVITYAKRNRRLVLIPQPIVLGVNAKVLRLLSANGATLPSRLKLQACDLTFLAVNRRSG